MQVPGIFPSGADYLVPPSVVKQLVRRQKRKKRIFIDVQWHNSYRVPIINYRRRRSVNEIRVLVGISYKLERWTRTKRVLVFILPCNLFTRVFISIKRTVTVLLF